MLFVTVEHTGTHETIRQLGLRVQSLEECTHQWPFTHLWDTHMDGILRAAERLPVLTTDRPYASVEATWRRNGRDLRELEAQWANWERIKRECDPWILKLGRR